jgi:hypothetical protein
VFCGRKVSSVDKPDIRIVGYNVPVDEIKAIIAKKKPKK